MTWKLQTIINREHSKMASFALRPVWSAHIPHSTIVHSLKYKLLFKDNIYIIYNSQIFAKSGVCWCTSAQPQGRKEVTGDYGIVRRLASAFVTVNT